MFSSEWQAEHARSTAALAVRRRAGNRGGYLPGDGEWRASAPSQAPSAAIHRVKASSFAPLPGPPTAITTYWRPPTRYVIGVPVVLRSPVG